MRYFSSGIILFTHACINLRWSRCGLVFGAALPFPHNWEKILIFSVFWFSGFLLLVFFFGLFKNKKHQPLPLPSGLSQNCQIVWLATTGESTMSCHRKPPLTHQNLSLTNPSQRAFPPRCWGAGGDHGDRCRASTLWEVWFYCEVNCMNTVTKEKKIF